jgi:hypothetical protein
VEIFLKYGAAPIPENYPLYAKLARSVLGLTVDVEAEQILRGMRKVLFKLLAMLRETEPGNNIISWNCKSNP